ncbi:hypothetical protein ACHQM5_010269 [Ranunculus cassubicifolius]
MSTSWENRATSVGYFRGSQLITIADKRRVFLTSYKFVKKGSLTRTIKDSFFRVVKRFIVMFRFRIRTKLSRRSRYRSFGRRRFQTLVQ